MLLRYDIIAYLNTSSICGTQSIYLSMRVCSTKYAAAADAVVIVAVVVVVAITIIVHVSFFVANGSYRPYTQIPTHNVHYIFFLRLYI